MKKALYLGLDIPLNSSEYEYIHYPLIEIIPYPPQSTAIIEAFQEIHKYTHLIFTSKSAVSLFFQYLFFHGYCLETVKNKIFIAVGQKTALKIREYGFLNILIAQSECAEGVVTLLETLNLEEMYLFWPHSQLSRSVINEYLKGQSLRFRECSFYNTQTRYPSNFPQFEEIDEIIFTSPSTVTAFLEIFSQFPENKILRSIGSVTKRELFERLAFFEKDNVADSSFLG